MLGRLEASRKTVQHTSRPVGKFLLQDLARQFFRIPRMNDNRFSGFSRPPKLLSEGFNLLRARRIVVVEVQSNLSPAQNLGVLHELLHLFSQPIVIEAGIVGMNAHAPVQALMVLHKPHKRVDALDFSSDTTDGQDRGHTGILCSLENLF